MSQQVKVNTIWEYNGNEFEFDMQDLEYAERYDAAMKNLANREKKAKKDGSLSERIKDYDDMIRSMFDDLLGDGAGDDVLGDKVNVRNCDEAYDSFITFIANQKKENDERSAEFINRMKSYGPNREQRRAAAKVTKVNGRQ